MKKGYFKHKLNFLWERFHKNKLWFHIVGLIAIIWFLFRVVPKPDRIRYPCQQMAIATASGYVAFWVILWSALFHGVGLWMRRAKTRSGKPPSIPGMFFAPQTSFNLNLFAISMYCQRSGIESPTGTTCCFQC